MNLNNIKLIRVLLIVLFLTSCSVEEDPCKMVVSITGNHQAGIYSVAYSDGTSELNPDGFFEVGQIICDELNN